MDRLALTLFLSLCRRQRMAQATSTTSASDSEEEEDANPTDCESEGPPTKSPRVEEVREEEEEESSEEEEEGERKKAAKGAPREKSPLNGVSRVESPSCAASPPSRPGSCGRMSLPEKCELACLCERERLGGCWGITDGFPSESWRRGCLSVLSGVAPPAGTQVASMGEGFCTCPGLRPSPTAQQQCLFPSLPPAGRPAQKTR